MSLFILAAGILTADPQQRTSQAGKAFVTATSRTPTDEDAALLSLIAFDTDACAVLANLRSGDSCSATGRAKLTTWTGKDGEEKHGLSVGCRARHERLSSEQAARGAGSVQAACVEALGRTQTSLPMFRYCRILT